MDDSSLLDEHHVFEGSPPLLYRNEKVLTALNLLILFATIISICYSGLHWSLWSAFVLLVFFGCMVLNCIVIGRVLTRMQERNLDRQDQFAEYVERMNGNPVIHEKFAPEAQNRLFGIKLPSMLQPNPAYV